MERTLPVSISIGAQVLAKVATDGTIEERFKKIIEPSNIANGCFMCGNEDEEFRAAVGGLMLSYPEDSPERERIAQEMKRLNQFSMMIQAAQLGMSAVPSFDEDDTFEAIGLMGLWRERTKR